MSLGLCIVERNVNVKSFLLMRILKGKEERANRHRPLPPSPKGLYKILGVAKIKGN
jgi:hypothetical protein